MKVLLVLSVIGIFFNASAFAQRGGGGDDDTNGPIQPAQVTYKPVGHLTIWFDCYTDTNVDCVYIEKAFFEKDTMTKAAANSASADVVITIRDWQEAPMERYEVVLTDKMGVALPVSMGKDQRSPLNMRANLTATSKIDIITANLMQGISVFHKIIDFQYNKKGQLVLTFDPKQDLSAPPHSSTKFYAQPSVGGRLLLQGATNAMLYANVLLGYTEASLTNPGWLIEFNPTLRYNYVSAPVGPSGAFESANNINTQNGLVVARSLTPHWAVATFLRANHDPSSNLNFQAQGHAGIEYELMPYLTTNDNAFTVNYLIGGNDDYYTTPNVHNKMHEVYATHAISLYDVWHTETYDLNASLGVTSQVADWSLWGVGGSVGGRLYITKTFTLDLNNSIGYKNNLVNAPANPSQAYELLEIVGVGGGVQKVTFQTSFTLRWVWGAAFTRQKDTRWQFTADEVPNGF